MKFWTVDEVANLVQHSNQWFYRRWKEMGLVKFPGSRKLRFTDKSVKETFGLDD